MIDRFDLSRFLQLVFLSKKTAPLSALGHIGDYFHAFIMEIGYICKLKWQYEELYPWGVANSYTEIVGPIK